MPSHILAGLAALVLLVGAVPGHAAPAPKEPPSAEQLQNLEAQELSGKVVTAEKGKVVIQPECGHPYAVLVDPNTSVVENGKVVSRSTLKEGATVRAALIPAGDRFFALAVEVEQPAR